MTRPGTLTRFFDEVLDFAKRFERRYHAAAYAELALAERRLLLSKESPETPKSLMGKGISGASLSSILIFKPDEIGDAVLALPALAALRRSHPQAWISVLCQNKTAPIYERTGLFNEVVGMQVRTRWRRFPTFDLGNTVAQMSRKNFEVGVFLRTYPAYFSFFKKLSANIGMAVFPHDPRLHWKGSRAITPFVSLWQAERPHQLLQMWQTLAPLLSEAERTPPNDLLQTPFPAFHWKPEDAVKELPARYLVAHPFNDLETKRYPVERWKEILVRAHQLTGLPVLIIGAKQDGEFPEFAGLTSLQGKLSLAQSGYVISRAAAFLGTSSGPAHWAAALGVPTLGLLSGHTSAEEWRFVQQAVGLRVAVSCSPCHLRTCNRHGLKCLVELTPARVDPELTSFLQRVQTGTKIVNQDVKVGA